MDQQKNPRQKVVTFRIPEISKFNMEAIQEIATLSSGTLTVKIGAVEEIVEEIKIEKVDDKEHHKNGESTEKEPKKTNNEETEEVTEQKENIEHEEINVDAKEKIEQPNKKEDLGPEYQNINELISNNLQEQEKRNQEAAELTQMRTEVDFEPRHRRLMHLLQMMEECDAYHITCEKIRKYLVSNIVGHLVIIFIHVCNLIYLTLSVFGKTSTDTTVKLEYFFNFFSIWVTALQITNSASRVFYDSINVYFLKEKLFSLQKSLHYINELTFGTFVWPFTMTMGLIFWPIYWYDRELIFPSYLDVIVGPVSHHILHTFTIVAALWQFLSCRREYYMVGINMALALVFILVYTLEFYDIYFADGIWLYPIVGMYYKYWGTAYAGIPLHVIITLLCYGTFCFQWLPQRWIPGPTEKEMMRSIKIHMYLRGPDVTVPLFCCQVKIYL